VAYFAQLDDTGTVVQVIAVSNDDAPDPATEHSEPLGQAFIADVLGLPGEWRQTSYNNNFRKQYAGPGFTYDPDADVFIAGNHDWQPPTPMPTEGMWTWDEDALAWVEIEPPA
jgi:hypothetical protein